MNPARNTGVFPSGGDHLSHNVSYSYCNTFTNSLLECFGFTKNVKSCEKIVNFGSGKKQ